MSPLPYWKTVLTSLADFAFPRICLACGRSLEPEERDLCGGCRADIPLTRFSSMSHNPMADRLNARLQERLDLLEEAPFEPYAYATALFFYSAESPYSAITKHLKYGRGFGTGRRFAAMLGEELAASPLFGDVDLVVPVPLHFSRRWKRGYNQAEIISEEVARVLGARHEPGLLRRSRSTRTQTALPVEEKMKNVSGAFTVPERRRKKTAREYRHILLLDDVFTTGSTLAACHAALREVFPAPVRISVATLAYTGEY